MNKYGKWKMKQSGILEKQELIYDIIIITIYASFTEPTTKSIIYFTNLNQIKDNIIVIFYTPMFDDRILVLPLRW